jgi:hypothetical protein
VAKVTLTAGRGEFARGAPCCLLAAAVEHGLGNRIHARFQGLEGDLAIPGRSAELARAAELDL